MLACLLLLIASALGVVAASSIKLDLDPLGRVGAGIALGQVLLLWLPFGFAAAFDLGARTAGSATLVALVGLCVGLFLALRPMRPRIHRHLQPLIASLAEQRLALIVIGAFLILFAWLLHTHFLLPRADGLHSAGVTWGDLPMHLALTSRFVYAQGLPPLEHPLFLHGALSYPFLPDYSVAVLCALGLPLRWAFIASGFVAFASLVILIPALTRLWCGASGAQRPLVSALSVILFLLSGGFGFAIFAARLFKGTGFLQLLSTTNATYLSNDVILKSGHIGNLFLAARTACYGMPIGATALLLLGHAHAHDVQTPPARAPLLIAGLLAGCLPLIHSHSFLVLCGIGLAYTAQRFQWRMRWVWYWLPLGLVAAPQLAWLLQHSNGGFTRFAPGFLRPASGVTQWLMDLVLGMGLSLFLLPLVWRRASPLARRLAGPLLLLLPLANLVTFTPTTYDNVKLLAWFDLAAAALLAQLFADLFYTPQHTPRRGLRLSAAWLGLLGCTLSGALALGHELCNDALVIGYDDLRLAELVTQHTPSSAIIATAASYHDPVAMFSGRRTLIATPEMLATHGIDVRERARDVVFLYAGGARARDVIARLGVSAVVVGPRERHDLPMLDEPFLASLAARTFETDGRKLYVLPSAAH